MGKILEKLNLFLKLPYVNLLINVNICKEEQD